MLGTKDGDSDLIPYITVGTSKSGSVAIIDGKLWLNGNNTNRSIAEFTVRNRQNSTEEEIKDAMQDFRFMAEPGRCLFPKLYAVGYSHLSTEILLDPICIARKFIQSLHSMLAKMLEKIEFNLYWTVRNLSLRIVLWFHPRCMISSTSVCLCKYFPAPNTYNENVLYSTI